MAATDVDWSMGSASARLADWRTAADVGRRVAGPGARVPAVERARMREELADLVPECELLISEVTGLHVDGFRSRAWVMSRSEWIAANLRSMQRLLEPLAARILAGGKQRAELRRKALGAQIGGLLGYVSRRVLGQYDVFLPPDDEGLLYFVGPNMAEAEARFGLPTRDFRFWVAAHEVCHRVQFGATPWLQGHLTTIVERYLGTISLDSGELLRQVSRAVEEVRRSKGQGHGHPGAFYLLMNEEQRELFHRTQGLMALLEGHASYVMNRVADGRVADLPRMRRALKQRRSAGRVERSFQRAVGFDSKIRQYDTGEAFVTAVVDRIGMDGFNAVWREEANLPTGEEIATPERWIARIDT